MRLIQAAEHTLTGHKGAISGVVWSDKAEIITASWDHTLKIWDSELCGIKHEITGNEPFFDVHYSPLARAVIASSSDNRLRLYDPRSSGIHYLDASRDVFFLFFPKTFFRFFIYEIRATNFIYKIKFTSNSFILN